MAIKDTDLYPVAPDHEKNLTKMHSSCIMGRSPSLPLNLHHDIIIPQPPPELSLASFDVTSAVKLVRRTHPERLAINGKFKMAQQGQVSNFSQRKQQPHFVSTIYNAPQMFGRNVFNLYIRNIP